MKNSIYKIKYLLFLSWDWGGAWCLTVWGVIPPSLQRNTAWNKGRKCFHCLGAPNNLIRPWSLDGQRSKYFSYAHSVISYGIIFLGNSSYSDDIFKVQKRIIRIIMNSSNNASCWQLFKELNILSIQCQYTGCPRRNVKYFGRVFLMLNYIDITQNTYIQRWTVTEIMAREKCGHLAFPRSIRLQLYREPPLPVVIWLRAERTLASFTAHKLRPTR